MSIAIINMSWSTVHNQPTAEKNSICSNWCCWNTQIY